MRRRDAYSSRALDVNPVPLSTAIGLRHPRCAAPRAHATPGQPEVGLEAHTLATQLINNGRDAKCPSVEHLVIDKSMLQCRFGPAAVGGSPRSSAMRLLCLTFMRSCSPWWRYSRYTRSFPTCHPSRLSITSARR